MFFCNNFTFLLCTFDLESAKTGLGINLLKGDNNRDKLKMSGDPSITDRILNVIEREGFEGQIPPKGDRTIFSYKGKFYKINREGGVKGLDGKVMKSFFHKNKRGPRIRIKRQGRDGKSYEGEIGVIRIMERKFGPYFIGYSLKKTNPKLYMLVPIDGNYGNMKYDNLRYVKKTEYKDSKKKIIQNYLLMFPNAYDKDMVKIFKTSLGYIQKIKSEMSENGKLKNFEQYQKIQKEIGIEFSQEMMPIYEVLWQTKGKISNVEIAKFLWLDEFSCAKNKREKDVFLNKVARVRKKMTDKGLFDRFNVNFENKKTKAIEMLKEKMVSGYTNQQIADILGLKKQQIDNLSKQIKKLVHENTSSLND